MSIFKKKIMYTSLSTVEDEDRSSYFGDSSLDGDGLTKTKASKTGVCKLTLCKVSVFVLVFLVVLSGI